MATDVVDEHHFKNQASLYEPTRTRLPKPEPRRTINRSTTTINTIETTHPRRIKYSTQTSMPTNSSTTSSINQRHSVSNDLISLFRSFAMKPFKTSSMTNSTAEGQTNIINNGNNILAKSPVSLLKYRPLSDNLTNPISYSQSTRQTEGFLKRMGWPVNSTTNDARVKWKIAMKFLIPVKFDVNRAINLYRTHENIRKNENLDRIWINNPQLIREIQSNKFFSLPQLTNQPLTVYFTAAAQIINTSSTNSLSSSDRELIALQALICQLDVATESLDVQQNGLNFIYDMQNCTASQFDMNLSKKILKLLQGGYPAMVKNTFIISAPKWFRIAYKVMMHTPEQMRDVLINQYGYKLDDIPVSLGGLCDPAMDSEQRYQTCLSTATNSQSICYPYYTQECQSTTTTTTTKSNRNILFFNTEHQHYHHNQTPDVSTTSPTTASSPTSLVAIVALKRNPESSQSRVQKRESSSSGDSEKRRRSNNSLIEEEESSPSFNPLTYIPHEIPSTDQLQQKPTSVINENSIRSPSISKEKANNDIKKSINENDNREYSVLKLDNNKRQGNSLYKTLNAQEFLSKTQSEIRQEYRKMPNPPPKDPFAAKEERNIDKSRYRDVLPGDPTRVKLQPDSDDKSDFINANYVSGYNNQEKAYIFTQGPLQSTIKDFWRMIWQENIAIIVMTTNIRESGTVKCCPYWPMETKEVLNNGLYQIQNEKSERFDSFTITTLILRKKNHYEQRIIYHAHFLKWPDHGVPSNTKDALAFLEKVEYYRQLTQTKAPILLHCSAGIGRTGTFCAIDIGIKRYLEKKVIDIPSTVVKMRTERAGSVQTEDQYVFAYLALMDFIKQQLALQERINETELTHTTDETKLNEVTDSTRKTSRTKTHGKKLNDVEQINNFNSGKTTNFQESTSYRGKTLSDSSVSAVQYLTPSTTNTQTEPTRQRSSTEHISSMPTTTGNVHHKKARK